ncbi:MAG: hypothetical protein AAF696_03290, partial [Bacteroidota bacterium]
MNRCISTLWISLLLCFFACKNSYEDTPEFEPPLVTTGEINPETKIVTGAITNVSNGIVDHGHLWATQPNPTINDSKTSLGSTNNTGTFSSTLTGLRVGETYYVTSYVLDQIDKVTIGSIKSFVVPAKPYTISTGTFSRTDGETSGSITAGIIDSGDLLASKFGHVWSTLNPPPFLANDNKTQFSDLSGTSFSSTIEPAFEDLG